MNLDVRRARTAFWWVGVIIPVSIIVLSALLVLAWLPEVPEPAAIHWGVDGVDGYGPGWTYLVLLLGLGGGMVAVFAVVALFAHRMPQAGGAPRQAAPQWSLTARLLGAANLATAGMLSFVALTSVAVQRGLADASDTPDITPWVMIALLGMLALGALGWFLQPRVVPASASAGDAAEPLPLSDSERAVWMRTVTVGRTGKIVLGSSVVLMTAMSVLLWTQDVVAGVATSVFAVILIALVTTSLTFRVRASSAGLGVRSMLGWPRIEIPAHLIDRARAISVHPFAEFGGWGYRIGMDGRRGFVLRTGDALEVTRTEGKVFVVTVDDAETAAAVLAAAAQR